MEMNEYRRNFNIGYAWRIGNRCGAGGYLGPEEKGN